MEMWIFNPPSFAFEDYITYNCPQRNIPRYPFRLNNISPKILEGRVFDVESFKALLFLTPWK